MDNNSLILGMASNQQDFTSIRILLKMSIEESERSYSSYISRIVRDAKAVLQSPSNISMIDRELYYYSMYLRDRGRDWIEKVNPDKLTEEDYKKMLEVFEMP